MGSNSIRFERDGSECVGRDVSFGETLLPRLLFYSGRKEYERRLPTLGKSPPVSNDGETHFVCVQGETSQTAWRLPVEKSIRT